MANIKESATGIEFPHSVRVPGTKELHVVGTGLREKKITLLSVKVYGCAFYVDQEAAKEALSSFQGKKLQQDAAFSQALIESTFEKAITIVLNRDIDSHQFSGGLNENLAPKLKALGAPPEVLSTFMGAFPQGGKLKNHTRIFLGLANGGVSVCTVPPGDVGPELQPPEGVQTATIKSPHLVAALTDVYVGSDSVAPSLKKSLADGIGKLLG